MHSKLDSTQLCSCLKLTVWPSPSCSPPSVGKTPFKALCTLNKDLQEASAKLYQYLAASDGGLCAASRIYSAFVAFDACWLFISSTLLRTPHGQDPSTCPHTVSHTPYSRLMHRQHHPQAVPGGQRAGHAVCAGPGRCCGAQQRAEGHAQAPHQALPLPSRPGEGGAPCLTLSPFLSFPTSRIRCFTGLSRAIPSTSLASPFTKRCWGLRSVMLAVPGQPMKGNGCECSPAPPFATIATPAHPC